MKRYGMRFAKRSALVIGAILLAACGDDSPTTPAATPTPEPSISTITATITPNPVIADANPYPDTRDKWPFMASFTVTVKETSGLAANVSKISITFTGNPTPVIYTVNWIRSSAGTNFIAGKGQLEIPMGLLYVGPSGGRVANVSVVVEAVDAKSNVVTAPSIFLQLT
jgi:hypothetical protein